MKSAPALLLALILVVFNFMVSIAQAADADQPPAPVLASDLRPAETPEPDAEPSAPHSPEPTPDASAEPEPGAEPETEPEPPPVYREAPAYDFGPVLSPQVWLWAEEDCVLYGANCRIAHAILGGESKHNLNVHCGDNGASCGPGQIQAGFQANLHAVYPQTRGWNRLIPRDNVRMVVFSVSLINRGDYRFVQRWSAYWVNWLGLCPPWWNVNFCRAYWSSRRY